MTAAIGVTKTGGAGDDHLKGTADDDQLFGGAGNDKLEGGKGDDLLEGGDGDDTLWDEDGSNRMLGGAGDDELLYWGDGTTVLDGGTGNDRLIFGRTSTTVFGGDGNDSILSRDFNSTVERTHTVDAGSGDDFFQPYLNPLTTLQLTGGTGRDSYDLFYATSTRGAGKVFINDFQAGIGGDMLSVDAQVDMMAQFAPTLRNPFVAGFARFLQSGTDTLFQVKVVEYPEQGAPYVSDDFFTVAILRNTNANAIVADNILGRFDPYGFPSLPAHITGTALPDRLRGGLSDDYIAGGDGNDMLTGGDGNDEIHGDGGNDALNGDRGDDIMHGGAGEDFLNGGDGSDQMYGGAGDDSFYSDHGDDQLSGGLGNDFMSAGPGNDKLLGGDGSDKLIGDIGSDAIDGGAGIDLAEYHEPLASIQIRRTAAGVEIQDNSRGTEIHIDVLTNVERLSFGGDSRTYAIDIDGNAGQAYRLYQAAFNRTPDGAGLKYWIGALDAGSVKLLDMAAFFIDSTEFKAAYGSNPGNGLFLDKLYDNILHRKPDAAGYDYWLNVLDKKYATQTELLASFSESAENVAALVGVIGNGFWIGDSGAIVQPAL